MDGSGSGTDGGDGFFGASSGGPTPGAADTPPVYNPATQPMDDEEALQELRVSQASSRVSATLRERKRKEQIRRMVMIGIAAVGVLIWFVKAPPF